MISYPVARSEPTQNVLTVEVARSWRKVPHNTTASVYCNNSSSPSLKASRPFSQMTAYHTEKQGISRQFMENQTQGLSWHWYLDIWSIIILASPLRVETFRGQVINVVLAKSWLTVGTGSIKTATGHFLSPWRLQLWLTHLAVGVIPTLGFSSWSKSYHSGEGQVETPTPGQHSELKKQISHTRGIMEISATIKDLKNVGGGRMVPIMSPLN